MRNAFALIHTWPELRNAEYEVVQRILVAARVIGAMVVVIDDHARVIWATPALGLPEGSQMPPDVVDFVLSLHFNSPRVIDAYSYITLWQPIDFYHQFGYQQTTDHVASHNDLISCDSDIADNHGINLMIGAGRLPRLPLPKMFHSLPEPYLPPRVSQDSRLFYIGINWERLGSAKGRFHETLITLDRRGLTDIYGPELMQGVAVWEGYDTYRGELPFDGESVKNAINQAGICLALSSASHRNTGIMSNRLFEGLAGGAAIIATPNPLIDKYFSDIVYMVDDARGEAVLGQQILEALRRIRSDPAEATRRVLEGQRILRESCSLEGSLQTLLATTAERVAHHEDQNLAMASVSVILTYAGQDWAVLKRYCEQFRRQKQAAIDLHVICTDQLAGRHGLDAALLVGGGLRSVALDTASLNPVPDALDGHRKTRDRTGPTMLRILRSIETPYFAFARLDDQLFQDHYASLVKAMQATPGALAGCAGMIIRNRGADGVERRTFHSLRFTDFDSVTLVNGVDQVGRFLFSATLLQAPIDHLLPLLDGEEHSYFRLAALVAGNLAQSDYATYMQDETARIDVQNPIEPVEHQQQYIRDQFGRNPVWLDRLARRGQAPTFIYALSPGTPIRWADYSPPLAVSQRIPLNRALATWRGGDGLAFLTSGFAAPEDRFSWLVAERGIIEFSLPDASADQDDDVAIVLRVLGRPSAHTGRSQFCTFALNGAVIAYDEVPPIERDVMLNVPLQLKSTTRQFRLEITPDHADQVFDAEGRVIDARRLSLHLSALTVQSRPVRRPPCFDLNELARCEDGERGALALWSNFYRAEPGLAWMAGHSSTLRFQLNEVPQSPTLRITLSGRRSLETGEGQSVVLTVNGVKTQSYDVGALRQTITVTGLSEALSGRLVTIQIKAKHAEAIFDDDHVIVDNRLLGLAIHDFEVVDA